MNSFWDKQIERADALAAETSGSKDLLIFYGHLLRAQKEIYDQFRSHRDWLPSGDLGKDLPTICLAIPTLLETVTLRGPGTLASEAQILLESDEQVIEQALIDYWSSPSDVQFFAKAIMQPYGRWLIESGAAPIGRELVGGERRCPRCGGAPQVS